MNKSKLKSKTEMTLDNAAYALVFKLISWDQFLDICANIELEYETKKAA